MSREQKTILCIDDHEAALSGWCLYLRGEGYGVMGCSHSEEGLQVFATNAIDCVILDYAMPELDGNSVAKAMKKMKPGVPIILLTGERAVPAELASTVEAVATKGEHPSTVLGKLDGLLGVKPAAE